MAVPTAEVLEPGLSELRSVLGSVVGNIIAVIRTIVTYMLRLAERVVHWAGEHPMAFTMVAVNLIILFS